jgi:integrase/recombinase XerD
MALDLIESFRLDCETRGLSKSTCETYVPYVKSLSDFLNGNLKKAGPKDLIAYLRYLRLERGLKQTSIERIFSSLSTFYDYLEQEGRISNNPVRAMRKRYLRAYKKSDESQMRRIITIEEAAKLVNSILDPRDRAIVILLLKTGIRRNELVSLDVEDVDLKEKTIRLKPAAKRSNRIVYIDSEAVEVLSRWLRHRISKDRLSSPALFLSQWGRRVDNSLVSGIVAHHAERVGLNDPKSLKLEDHFTPHCCRHWFTTHLIRSGMPRDFVKELRGDARREAIDIYNHIDKKELKESYLAHIPQLGI